MHTLGKKTKTTNEIIKTEGKIEPRGDTNQNTSIKKKDSVSPGTGHRYMYLALAD
jgi:hypothetical protein